MRTNARLALLALFAVAFQASAQSPVEGPEFQVNTVTADYQADPAVAVLTDDDFVVVWDTFGQDGSQSAIFGQRFDPNGEKLGSEFQVNGYTTGYQYQPSVSSDAAGNFVVVWEDDARDGSGYGVFGRRFDSSGTPLGGDFPVNAYTTGDQFSQHVAVAQAGSFVVVWQSNGQDGSGPGVFAQRFDSSGNKAGGEFQVNQYTAGYQAAPRVAVAPSGSFIVTWASPQDSALGAIMARRYDSSGAPLGGEFQVNTTQAGAQYLPDVAIDSTGSAVFAWISYAQDGSGSGIFARRTDGAGYPIGAELNVNTFTTGSQFRPRVATGPSGDFMVAWHSFGQDDPADPAHAGIFAQRFDANGHRDGGELLVNTYTTDDQRRAALAADSRGQFVVTWDSYGQDGSGYGVEARLSGFPKSMSMRVDESPSAGVSNVNGVLEAGERVLVSPTYGNPSGSTLPLAGTASNFTGPAGPTYALNDPDADYGSIPPHSYTDGCNATGNCYEFTVDGARPSQHWDARFDEALSYQSFARRWTLHVGGSFFDVPQNAFYPFVENLFHNGVTGGCAGGGYCPGNNVTRAQMAVFLLKARYGSGYRPPAATGTVFTDVPASNLFAPWIENLFALGITGGCGTGLYCPDNPVTRQQMAVFILKTKYGAFYVPPTGVGLFGDVTCPGVLCDFIERLYNEGITGGCQTNPVLLYCPTNPNLRQQMAVFLVKGFGLQLYGP